MELESQNSESGIQNSPQPKRSWLRLLLLIAFGAAGLWMIVSYGVRDKPYPVDAYYYLAKAENLRGGKGLTVYWNDGVDRKFFPLQSIALAPLTFLRFWWLPYWVILSIITYILNAAILWNLAREVEPSEPVRFAALAFWLCNPNVLLWSSVPYAEGLASVLAWGAVAVCARGWRSASTRRFLGAALLGGLAVTARAEAALLALAFAVLVAVQAVREGPRSIPWRRLAAGAVLFAAPFALYWLSLPAVKAGPKLWYVHEFFVRFSFGEFLGNLVKLLHCVLLEDGIELALLGGVGAWPLLGLARYAVDIVSLIALVLALGGWLGRRARWAAVALLAYQALHALWHYSYGRFDYLVVPLAAYVLACGLAALFRIGRRAAVRCQTSGAAPEAPRVRSALLLAAVCAIAVLMAFYGYLAIRRQQYVIDRMDVRLNPSTRAAIVATLATSLRPGDNYLCATADLWLAYRLGAIGGAHAWFEEAKPDFCEAPFQPQEAMAFMNRHAIRWIATRRSREDWLADYRIPADRQAEFVGILETPTFELIERVVGR